MRQINRQIQSVEDMVRLSGIAFEGFLADAFRDAGYAVDATLSSSDYGANFILARDGRKVVVRASQSAGAVGLDAVREAHFAKDYYKADEAWVIALHGFTPQVTSAAQSTGVRLVSGEEIMRMVGGEELTPRCDTEPGMQFEPASSPESDTALFTLAGNELLQYHGRERNVVIPSGLGIKYIESRAFSDPGAYATWPEGFVDPVCDWGRIQSVVVPEGVTTIGHSAFRACTSLRFISLPSTLQHIGACAFESCVSLQKIELPQGIKSIGYDAFACCESLSAVTFPQGEGGVEVERGAFRETGIKSLALRGSYQLGERCFERCYSLASVSIGAGVESLPALAFKLCRSLTDVRLPDTLASIGDGAFTECRALESVEIPNSVTKIGSKAFFECPKLSSIHIPPRVEVIGSEAFGICSMLSDITLSEGVKSIEEGAFFACKRMRKIVLPASVEEVASRAFASCDALADVTIPPSVRTIRPETFERCTALVNVTLSEGLETIEGHAFWKCAKLRRVQLPASVNTVAPHAFEDCVALEEVDSSPDCSGTIHRSAFLGCPLMERDDPIGGLPATAHLVNDARFPSMFDGPSHELRALRFVSEGSRWYSSPPRVDYLIVDRGIEGPNSFSCDQDDVEKAAFWVVLNEGCERGYYAVRGTQSDGTATIFDGYLEPNKDARSSRDPSRFGFLALQGPFAVYLHNCHLIASPTNDGELAAGVVDAYRDKVEPLVEEFEQVEADASGKGRKFEERKLAALDKLHAKIKAANVEFKNEAKHVGLDDAFYVSKYAASYGDERCPSKKAARTKEAERREKAMAKRRTSSSLSSAVWTLFEWLVTALITVVVFVLGLAVIVMLILL